MDKQIRKLLREYTSVPLFNGYSLETSVSGTGIDRQIDVYIVDPEGMVSQDICLVRPHTDEDAVTTDLSKVDCIVWADESDEDYTNLFTVEIYKEETEDPECT